MINKMEPKPGFVSQIYEAQLSGERVRLGCKGVRDRFLVEDKKYLYSPLNISELCFLKCEFEYDDLG